MKVGESLITKQLFHWKTGLECECLIKEPPIIIINTLNRDEKLEEVYEAIECELEILGATAIEDKLQVI